MRLHLVRHGQTAAVGRILAGRGGPGLDRAGQAQAEAAAARLSRGTVRRVLSSPQRRARETAAAIADAVGTGVEVSAGLDEIAFGRWTGCAFAALETDPDWRLWNADRGLARTPGGETMGDVADRALRAIWAAIPGRGDLVAVSHLDVIRPVLLRMQGRPMDEFLDLEVACGAVVSVSRAQLSHGVRL